MSKQKEHEQDNNNESVKENKEEEDNKFEKQDKERNKKIEELEEELAKAKEEKLRVLAEMENLRKRAEKENTNSIKFGSANLARAILSPCDNLIRALESLKIDEKKDKKTLGLVNGIKMVHQEILSLLEKNGVKKIEALNKKFDHNLHQAMTEIESEDTESGIVIKEFQTGYTMYDRLLRPSMVGVSKKKENKKNN